MFKVPSLPISRVKPHKEDVTDKIAQQEIETKEVDSKMQLAYDIILTQADEADDTDGKVELSSKLTP